jgi:hypothetical protein
MHDRPVADAPWRNFFSPSATATYVVCEWPAGAEFAARTRLVEGRAIVVENGAKFNVKARAGGRSQRGQE